MVLTVSLERCIMAPRVILGSPELGAAIRQRRSILGFSIAEAAKRAGVSEKTWGRYEVGESIRTDKARAVCRTLGWSESDLISHDVSDSDAFDIPNSFDIGPSHEAWSPFLQQVYGRRAAMGFAIGSDTVLDGLNDDIENLGKMPRGSHIGELEYSLLADLLPKQFLLRYDYDFMYKMRARLCHIREQLHLNKDFQIHMAADELLLALSFTDAYPLEDWVPENDPKDDTFLDDSLPWEEYSEEVVGGICGDIDYQLMYSKQLIPCWLPYHFDNWFVHTFHEEDNDSWDGMLEMEQAVASRKRGDKVNMKPFYI
jgi:transcriptional regulator with XRE-family HTH domain